MNMQNNYKKLEQMLEEYRPLCGTPTRLYKVWLGKNTFTCKQHKSHTMWGRYTIPTDLWVPWCSCVMWRWAKCPNKPKIGTIPKECRVLYGGWRKGKETMSHWSSRVSPLRRAASSGAVVMCINYAYFITTIHNLIIKKISVKISL